MTKERPMTAEKARAKVLAATQAYADVLQVGGTHGAVKDAAKSFNAALDALIRAAKAEALEGAVSEDFDVYVNKRLLAGAEKIRQGED
jgi:hypothetical protein